MDDGAKVFTTDRCTAMTTSSAGAVCPHSIVTVAQSPSSTVATKSATSAKQAAATNIPRKSSSEPKTKLCVAVVGTKGDDLVLFDASGNPRTFAAASKGDGKLCFSTHGMEADVLTHCFDKDGFHGTPEVDCFCGVDTPHLHAHLHDPKHCNDESSTSLKNLALGGSVSTTSPTTAPTIGGARDLTYLGLVTLHPVVNSDETTPLFRMPVSEELPNQCNSSEMSRHMLEFGMHPPAEGLGRRIQKIQVRQLEINVVLSRSRLI